MTPVNAYIYLVLCVLLKQVNASWDPTFDDGFDALAHRTRHGRGKTAHGRSDHVLGGHGSGDNMGEETDSASKEDNLTPHFDPTSPTHVTAQLGSHAYLPSRIRNLGNKSVSWVRNMDAHILTVDSYTFIADLRFAAWHEAATLTWTLQIKFLQKEDAGRYECQVSTEPKMSHFVTLIVVTPEVSIPGGPEFFVRSGSQVSLKCVVSQALHPPAYVFWFHENRRVLEGSWTGVVQKPLEWISSEMSAATLTIASAAHTHAGNYTCQPATLTPAFVSLHVLNGEHPAAMQHGDAASTCAKPYRILILVLAAFIVLIHRVVLAEDLYLYAARPSAVTL